MFKFIVYVVAASKFTSAMAADGLSDAAGLTEEELDRIYSPLRQQVSDSIHKQETVMYNVEVRCIRNDSCFGNLYVTSTLCD